jgi:hypothetical protein
VNGGKSTQGKEETQRTQRLRSDAQKASAPPCRSSTLLQAVRIPHAGEAYRERAAPAVRGDSLRGDVDEAESLETVVDVRCGVEARSIGQQIAANPCEPSLQAAARRREPIRRLSGGVAAQRGLRRLERRG